MNKAELRQLVKECIIELNESNNLKFNVKPYNMHPHGDINWKGKLVWTSPDKFLSLARKLTHPSSESLNMLRKKMLNNEPIEHLTLWVDMDNKKVKSHEGRHRALIAKELGIKEVPVFVFTGSNYDRVPKWKPEDHKIVDELNFSPET